MRCFPFRRLFCWCGCLFVSLSLQFNHSQQRRCLNTSIWIEKWMLSRRVPGSKGSLTCSEFYLVVCFWSKTLHLYIWSETNVSYRVRVHFRLFSRNWSVIGLCQKSYGNGTQLDSMAGTSCITLKWGRLPHFMAAIKCDVTMSKHMYMCCWANWLEQCKIMRTCKPVRKCGNAVKYISERLMHVSFIVWVYWLLLLVSPPRQNRKGELCCVIEIRLNPISIAQWAASVFFFRSLNGRFTIGMDEFLWPIKKISYEFRAEYIRMNFQSHAEWRQEKQNV